MGNSLGCTADAYRVAGSLVALTIFCFILAMVLFGSLRGFPRWSFPYTGSALISSLILANASTPGLWLFGYERGSLTWGWLAWLPLLAVTLLALAVTLVRGRNTASRPPLHRIWVDWTLLSFAIYGMLYPGVFVVLDEVQSELAPLVVALGAALLALGAWANMRAVKSWQRAAALVIGYTAAFAVVAVFAIAYWQSASPDFLYLAPSLAEAAREMVVVWLVFLALLLSPALLVAAGRTALRLHAA